MIRAPCAWRYRIVGSAARMRESSVTLPSSQRDVEVDAHEDALARGVEVPDGELVHLQLPPGAARGPGQASRSATNFTRSATRQL